MLNFVNETQNKTANNCQKLAKITRTYAKSTKNIRNLYLSSNSPPVN